MNEIYICSNTNSVSGNKLFVQDINKINTRVMPMESDIGESLSIMLKKLFFFYIYNFTEL